MTDALRREWESMYYGRPLHWQPASKLTVRNWRLITVRIPTEWADSWWGVPETDPDALGHERPAMLWKDARYSSTSASGVHIKVYRNKLDAIDDRGGIDCMLPPEDCDLT